MRWVSDSIDELTQERIKALTEDIKLEDCQNISMRSVTCPKGRNFYLERTRSKFFSIGLDPRSALQDC